MRSIAHHSTLFLAVVLVILAVVAWSSPAEAFTICGNSICEPGGFPAEDCETCPEDCGGSCSLCGNGYCGSGENCSTCSADCGTCTDSDGDGVWDFEDNCLYTANPAQEDCDGDGTGDACDSENSNYVYQGTFRCGMLGWSYGASSSVTEYFEKVYEDESACNQPTIFEKAGTKTRYCGDTADPGICCRQHFSSLTCLLNLDTFSCGS